MTVCSGKFSGRWYLACIWVVFSCSPGPEAQPTLIVDITGAEYQWHIRYPGADGQQDTSDDLTVLQNLYLPRNRKVTLRLTSDDYLYTFSLPDFDLKEVAVPEMIFTLELQPKKSGTFQLRGDQFCGYAHSSLLGELVVLEPQEFKTWFQCSKQKAD